MKRRHLALGQLILVGAFAAAQANAANADQHLQPVRASLTGSTASLHATGLATQSAAKSGKLRHKPIEQANLASFGGGVVQEMRATSALVEETAAKAGTSDSWLIMLAALGLVVLQLRRKHKSLPQRRIAPYA
jgi:hypothetical protein